MKNRYEFVLIFDVKDANPNGDPDAGNLPRIDPGTSQGIMTDVCLKRKIRNFIQTTQPNQKIYFTEGAVHNRQHEEAYKESKLEKSPKVTQEPAKQWMCKNFYDVRTFGAVMSTGDFNCGQVRGPVQLSFARSIDPITTSEHAITRSSVTNEKDVEKARTMGRKFTVPYGLYRAHGFINPFLAEQTGFGVDDKKLLFEALKNMFLLDASAARPAGSMAMRQIIVFEHENQLGMAPSHHLFDAVQISKNKEGGIPISYDDYTISVKEESIPNGVKFWDEMAVATN